MDNWNLEEAFHHIGQVCKQKRLDLDLTQKDMAVRSGISLTALQKLESGCSVSGQTMLAHLASLGLLGTVLEALPSTEVPDPEVLLKRQRDIQLQSKSARSFNTKKRASRRPKSGLNPTSDSSGRKSKSDIDELTDEQIIAASNSVNSVLEATEKYTNESAEIQSAKVAHDLAYGPKLKTENLEITEPIVQEKNEGLLNADSSGSNPQSGDDLNCQGRGEAASQESNEEVHGEPHKNNREPKDQSTNLDSDLNNSMDNEAKVEEKKNVSESTKNKGFFKQFIWGDDKPSSE